MRPNSRPTRIATELVVVVLGVLIALAADSWWEDHQDRARLTENLQALTRDMDVAGEGIERALAVDRATIATIARGEEILANRDRDAVESIPFDSLSINVPPLPLGTLRALVGAGDLRHLSNESLRLELIQGLSQLDLIRGWMDDLATDGRAAIERMEVAQSRATITQTPWPTAALTDPDALAGLRLLRGHLENIVMLGERSAAIVAEIARGTRAELGEQADR